MHKMQGGVGGRWEKQKSKNRVGKYLLVENTKESFLQDFRIAGDDAIEAAVGGWSCFWLILNLM